MESDKIILGEGCIHEMNSKVTGLNNNVLVCATTGAGKTMSVVEPHLLHSYNNSLVVVLSKRALVERYSKILQKRGYKILDLNLAHPEHSQVGYDPLAYVKTSKDITNLAKALITSSKEGVKSVDPYWDLVATSMVSALIAIIHQNRDKGMDTFGWNVEKGPTFKDVLNLYNSLQFGMMYNGMTNSNLDHLFKSEGMDNPGNFATKCWKSVEGLPNKTLYCAYSCCNVVMDKVFTAEIERLIEMKNKIEITQLAKEKTVLFVTVSATDIGQQTFTNIFYTNLFGELFDYAQSCPNGELPIPVHIICDDFAATGKIADFERYISIFRAAGMSISMLLQSESQLEYLYGERQATTIINNCDTYVYLGGMDLKTCCNISQRLNLPLDEVMYMPIDKEIVFQRGRRPVITKRYNILDDDLYRQTEADYLDEQLKKSEKQNDE